jgi:hypothetical protein
MLCSCAAAVPTRGEAREGSGRDGIVPLMLQRDYRYGIDADYLSFAAILSPRALAHSQLEHFLSGRSHACSGCCS